MPFFSMMILNYTVLFYLFLSIFSSLVIAQMEDPSSGNEYGKKDVLDVLTEDINKMNTTWTAKKPDKIMDLLTVLRELPDVPPVTRNIDTLRHRSEYFGPIPVTFDAKLVWPECEDIIGRIRNQGKCGSCWAVNSASVISDRICIGSNGTIKFHASAEDLLSCCTNCIAYPNNICGGGYGAKAFQYWRKRGVVTGGELDSDEGCKPYSDHTYNSRLRVSCLEKCSNKKYLKTYSDDKIYGKIAYRLPPGAEKQIMYDLMTHGPVMALVVVYEDFFVYNDGVYQHKEGKKVTNHFVKLVGWGTEGDQPYWMATNSWGTNWGLGGHFKILKGENHCEIEAEVSAGRLSSQVNVRSMVISKTFLFKPSLVQCVWMIGLLVFFI